jgi:hypothetical protein
MSRLWPHSLATFVGARRQASFFSASILSYSIIDIDICRTVGLRQKDIFTRSKGLFTLIFVRLTLTNFQLVIKYTVYSIVHT